MQETINFTGLEVRRGDLLCNRIHPGPFPVKWPRIVIEHNDFNMRPIQSWVIENTFGRFGLIQSYPRIVIYFEDEYDAVLFRLKGGDEACQEASVF